MNEEQRKAFRIALSRCNANVSRILYEIEAYQIEEDFVFEGAVLRLEECAKQLNEYLPKPEPKKIQAVSKDVARNKPCHCGSGKKYKKCCMLLPVIPYSK